jgi:hypothetical protein
MDLDMRVGVGIMAALALGAQIGIAQQVTKQPGQITATDTTKVTATVTAIDKATRTVTLKTAEGKVFDLPVGDEARNFDQLTVGDVVVTEYKQALSVNLKKSGGTASASENDTLTRSPAGAKPGGTMGREVTVSGTLSCAKVLRGIRVQQGKCP